LNIEAVAQGIAMGIFTGREGSQLLYAAQVALSAIMREKKSGQTRRRKQV
jgi:hypothetical protein